MQKILFSFIIIILSLNCSKKAVPSIDVTGSQFSLAVNEKAVYNTTTITVTDIRESRCPMNARCIRAGEAIAVIAISDKKNNTSLSLCTGPDCSRMKQEAQNVVTLGNDRYQFDLENIIPDPTKTLSSAVKKAVFSIKKIK